MLRDTVLEIYEKYTTKPVVIYGDTDSNFNDMCITTTMSFNIQIEIYDKEINKKKINSLFS
jgi:hypothetical protein